MLYTISKTDNFDNNNREIKLLSNARSEKIFDTKSCRDHKQNLQWRKDMDIETLRTFLILANTKNFTRTAGQMFIAQSTVTNRISELEKELQVSLFYRTNRSVELTPEGTKFKEYASKVIDLTDSSMAELTSFKKYVRHLRIGASDSIYEGHLAPILLHYQQNHPDNSLKITIGLSSHLLELLQNDILDVAFTYLPLSKSSFHCDIFKQDSMVLVTDYKNQKYRTGITKEDLLYENYLMCNFALQDVGQFIRGLFPKYHQFALEIDDCSKIIPFLIGQDNYTFLPKNMAVPFLKANRLRMIPLLDFQTPVINSYIIGKKSTMKLWEDVFLTHNK